MQKNHSFVFENKLISKLAILGTQKPTLGLKEEKALITPCLMQLIDSSDAIRDTYRNVITDFIVCALQWYCCKQFTLEQR